MGYYMRYIVTDGELRLVEIEEALRGTDGAYRLHQHSGTQRQSADLYHGDELYGELEINRPGDGLFEDEIAELREMVEEREESDEDGRRRVVDLLTRATGMLAVRVLWQGRDAEPTLERLDPLWRWLHDRREGLLQADSEGYYDQDGLVLAVE
jgi:hypothetical protein